jgi:hypothetical protein
MMPIIMGHMPAMMMVMMFDVVVVLMLARTVVSRTRIGWINPIGAWARMVIRIGRYNKKVASCKYKHHQGKRD